jgi:hypothetical protein
MKALLLAAPYFLLSLPAFSAGFASPLCVPEVRDFFSGQAVSSESLNRIATDGLVETFPMKSPGQWLEKHLFPDGRIELHAVGIAGKKIYSWTKTCKLQQRQSVNDEFSTITKGAGFSDGDLATLLKGNKGLIYVWSPRMPLSVRGVKDFAKAAASFGLPVTFLLDPFTSARDEEIAKREGFPVQRLRSFDLMYRGALLHFPGFFYYSQGRVHGAPVLGSRGEQGYKNILAKMVSKPPKAKEEVLMDGNLVPNRDKLFAKPLWIKVRKISKPVEPDLGYFDKPVWGTRWLGVHKDWANSYLYHLDTGQLVDTGYTNDTYVTPTDHLYTIFWADEPGKLGLVETEEFLKLAEDPTHKVEPLFTDDTFNVFYQSVGTLQSGEASGQYRVVTGTESGPLRFRDYEITHRTSTSAPFVRPLGSTGTVCHKTRDFSFGLPMLSKNGLEVGVNSDDTENYGVVYALDKSDAEKCRLALTMGTHTSKMAFDFSGRLIAFSSFGGGVFLYDRASMQMYKLEGFQELLGPGLAAYPDFREDGSLLVPYVSEQNGLEIAELEYDLP